MVILILFREPLVLLDLKESKETEDRLDEMDVTASEGSKVKGERSEVKV